MKRLLSSSLLLSSVFLASCGGGGGGESSTTTTNSTSSSIPLTSDPSPIPPAPSTSRVNDFYRGVSQHLRLDQTQTIFGSVLTQYQYDRYSVEDIDIVFPTDFSLYEFSTNISLGNGETSVLDFDISNMVNTDISDYDIYRLYNVGDGYAEDILVSMQNDSRQTDYTAYGTWASAFYDSVSVSLSVGSWADGTGYYEGGRSPQDNGLTSGTYTYRGDSVGKLFAIFSNDVAVYGNYEADVVLQYNGSSDSISGCVGCNKGQFIDVQSNNPDAARQWTIDPRLAVKFDFPSTRLDGNQFTTTNLNVTPAIPEVTSTSGFTGELSGQFSDDSEGVIGTYSTQGTVRYANGLTVTGGAIGSFATEKE